MQEHATRNDGVSRGLMTALVAVIVLSGLTYVFISPTTEPWRDVGCRVTSSRVVRAEGPVGPAGVANVMYKGEYGVAYSVNGRDYFIWAHSDWLDTNRSFVEAKVAALPAVCPFRVSYNPDNPADALAVRK